MKPYLIALAAGLLAGVIYGLINVRSPAPPVIALVGLLGILLGEQIVPLAKRVFAGHSLTVASVHRHSANHVFGRLPCADIGPERVEVASRSESATGS